MAVESWTTKNKATGQDEKHHGVSPERFRLACDVFAVPKLPLEESSPYVDFRDRMHAFEIASLIANAQNDAPKQVLVEARQRVRDRERVRRANDG